MQFETEYKLNLQMLTLDTLLLCGDPLGERYPIARVQEAINDVTLDFCLKTHMIKDTLNIALKTDQIFYNLKKETADKTYLKDYGYPIRLTFNGVKTAALWPTSLATIDLFSDSQIANSQPFQWHLDSVSPGKVVIYGLPTEEGFDDTNFTLDSDTGLIRYISSEDGELPFSPDDVGLRDITGPIAFHLIRDAGGNIVRVLVGISEDNNLQCTYISFPDYMTASDSNPDTIPSKFHDSLSYGAAARLLFEGNTADFKKAVEFDILFETQTRNAIAEIYRGETQYDSVTPI